MPLVGGVDIEVVLEVVVVGPALDAKPPLLEDEEVRVGPTPLDCWPCCVVLPVLC